MFDYNSRVLGASMCGHIHLQAEYLLACINHAVILQWTAYCVMQDGQEC